MFLYKYVIFPPPPPPHLTKKPNKKTKLSGSIPAPRSGYATTIMVFFFAHLLILQYPDHHQNLISSSLHYSGPLHKISSQSVHNFLNNVVHRQTDKLTNQRFQKHNLLCQGGKNSFKYAQYGFSTLFLHFFYSLDLLSV